MAVSRKKSRTSKRRIAYVITGLALGGAETQLARLAIAFHKKSDVNEVLVISLTGSGVIGDELKKAGVRVEELHFSNPHHVWSRLHKRLKEFRPDIIHSYLWHANIAARFAAIGTGAPVICSIRGKEPNKIRDMIEFVSRPLVSRYTTNSAYIASYFHLPKSKARVIMNAVPDTFWRGAVHKAKPKTAIMVGQLRWEKDYRTLIKTAALAKDWHFTIVGGGPRESELRELIAELNASNVTMLGERSDVKALMLRHEVLIHLAFTEGSPNTVIEAMLLGVPVIASDIPAIRELVAVRGTLVKGQDPVALASALKLKSARTVKPATTRWARETFAIDRLVKEHENLYKEFS